MLKKIIPMIFLSIAFNFAIAQDNRYGADSVQIDGNDGGYNYSNTDSALTPKLRHYFVGGNFIASFGNGGGAFGINPSIGYAINPYVDVGVGVNAVYNYSKDFYNDGGKSRTWNLGLAPYARIYPIEFLYFEGSFEENLVSTRYIEQDGTKDPRQNYSAPSLIGAIGYTNRIYGQSSFFISVGMDFLNNKNSPYREQYLDNNNVLRSRAIAIIRTGFNINLW